ncbi:MAG: hypothetical protein ACK2UL_04090, partial [Anaerolineae bacterium]
TVYVTASVGRVVNRAVASTADEEPDLSNNAAEAGTDVLPTDLRVAIGSVATQVRPGETVTHTVSVNNVSVLPAENVTVDLDLGGTGVHVSDTAEVYGNGFTRTMVEGGVRWSRSVMPGPSGYSIDVVTRVPTGVPAGTPLVYTATVGAATADNDPSNNEAASDPVQVLLPDLWLTKRGPAELGPGAIATYTLQYGNRGAGDAPNTRVTDSLPVDFQYLGSFPAATEQGTDAVTWSVGLVPAAFQDIVRLWGRVGADVSVGSELTNRAEIASQFGDEDASDNVARTDSLVEAGPPAVIDLAVPDLLIVGGASGQVTAEVRDASSNLVTDGTAVVLDTTLGRLAKSHLRTSAGVVTTTLTSGPVPGTAVVSAMAGDVTEQAETLVVSGPPAEAAVTASTDAPTVGEDVVVEVAVTDSFGNRVTDGYPVSLEAARGVVEPAVALTSLGVASARWRNTLSGSDVLTATAGPVTVTQTLVFEPGDPHAVDLSIAPSAVGVGGEQALLRALVQDRFGNLVRDGTTVKFSATRGDVGPAQRVTAGGVAETTYLSGPEPVVDELAAVAGAANGMATVDVRPADLGISGRVDGPRGRARDSYTYPGESVTYTLAALNTDLGVASDVVLGVAFPAAWLNRTVVASRAVTATDEAAPGLLPPPQEGRAESYWQLPDLGPGDAVTLTITGDLGTDQEWGAFQTLFFRSAITSTTPEASVGDLDNTDQVAVHAADYFMGLELDSHASRVEPGGSLVYVLSFGNATAGNDGMVRITDTLPAFTSYDHWQAGQGTEVRQAGPFTSAARELVWEIDGEDAASGSVRLWLDIASDAPTQRVIVNSAVIGATVYDYDLSNNSAADGGVWLSGVNLVAGIDAADTAEPGEAITTLFEIANRAQRDTASDVVAVADPPAGLLLERTFPPALVLGDGRVMWRSEELAPGSVLNLSAIYSVPEEAVPGTVFTHEFEVTSAGSESYPGDNQRFATTRVVPGPAAEIIVGAEPVELVACGVDGAELVARVLDEHGNPVADGTEVEWRTDLGATDVAASVTSLGRARARLTAGMTPGTATVTAQSGQAVGRVVIEMVPGPPRVLSVTASPRVVGFGGRTTISAVVLDECSNRVSDGWPITFAADRGEFDDGGAMTTRDTVDGRVAARLLVGPVPGPLRVRAAHGLEWGETMVSVDTRPAGATVYLPHGWR